MAHIVIIGNTLEGLRVIERLTAADPDIRTTVLCGPDERPHEHQRVCDFIGGRIPLDQFAIEHPFRSEKIIVRNSSDEQIDRILFKKKEVVLKNKDRVSYDYLIIAGTDSVALPAIRGSQKNGVFGLLNFSHVRSILNSLNMTETIVLSTSSPWGFRAAETLTGWDKEVIVVAPSTDGCPGSVDKETWQEICHWAEQKNIRMLDNRMTEILGDQEVKAIRLDSGKVLACQMVIFPDAPLDLRIFKNSEIMIDGQIPVKECFLTRCPDVYALIGIGQSKSIEGMCLGEMVPEVVNQQAALVAGHIRKETVPAFAPLLRQASISYNHATIDFIGDTCCREGISFANIFDGERTDPACRVFIKHGYIVGAVLFNRPDLKSRMVQAITQKTLWETGNRDFGGLSVSPNKLDLPELRVPDRSGQAVTTGAETPGEDLVNDNTAS